MPRLEAGSWPGQSAVESQFPGSQSQAESNSRRVPMAYNEFRFSPLTEINTQSASGRKFGTIYD
jgi:hypothetical protein